jgi:hypothetical protein
MTASTLEILASYGALGLIVGFGYYSALRWQAVLAATEGVPSWWPVALNITRIGAAIVFFAWLASFETLVPILSAFVGFLIGRMIAFQMMGEDA